MPKIPVYEQQVSLNAPTPQNLTLATPPASVSSTSMNEAGARLGDAVAGIGDKLAAHAIDFRRRENEKTLFKLDTDYGARIDAALFDPKKGLIATRKLGGAAGITADFGQFHRDTLAEIEAIEAPESVKQALLNRATTRLESAKSAAVKYEADQLNEDYKGKFNANVASQTRALSYSASAKDFLNGRVMLHATVEAEAGRLGVSPEVKAQMMAAADTDALAAYVGGNIESNPAAALSTISAFKGVVDNKAFTALESKARENLFISTVSKDKMAGMGKDEILKKYVLPEKDANRQADMATVVNKAFATTEPYLYRQLFRGVQAGTVKDADLDSALNAGKLTQGDWEGLWKASTDARSGKTMAPAMKVALADIELEVNRKYSNKQQRDEAMFVFEQKALAYPNPDIFRQEAMKSIEGRVVAPAIFHDSEEHGWKDELDAMRSDSAERAAEVDRAIGVLNRTGKKVSPANVDLLINYWRTSPNDKRFQ